MRALALGEKFSCGITGVPGTPGTTSPAGTIWCWGDNEFGQLGRGVFSPNGQVLGPLTFGWLIVGVGITHGIMYFGIAYLAMTLLFLIMAQNDGTPA